MITKPLKNTQNTRLSYLRTIKLGGQKEKLYNETNIYEMAVQEHTWKQRAEAILMDLVK